ncbi:baseplate J/gp47 family protein [Clostridium novyi]|uniref:baseplate J/gp47 family protein n=1 Tax=Clostridium novyi TaxID=1542 RepID=UPI0004D8903C|nr:baseplate J/gp47 family protein [Clostridium novyi]KEH88892.1 baseplate J family protein [Clostridium novyi A str. GD211209]
MYSEDSKDILNRMLSYLEIDVSKCEGTLIHDALAPAAYELEDTREDLDDCLDAVFAKTALENGYSDELEMRAEEHGVFRKQGKCATTYITFYGAKGTKIEEGTLVQTQLGIRFKTTKEDTIKDNRTVVIPVQALEEGTKYNVKAKEINQLPIALIGIDKVENLSEVANGRDTETDEQLYNRLILKVRTPATSGNKNEYKLWAMETSGVGNAIVIPRWQGRGTVKVVIVDSNGKAPSSEIINNVTKHIEDVRPIGADVTITGITEVGLNISVKVIANKSDLQEIKKDIQTNIQDYLKSISLKTDTVRYNRIVNCVLNVAKVTDFTELKINDDIKDIKLEKDSIAILKNIEVVVDSVT